MRHLIASPLQARWWRGVLTRLRRVAVLLLIACAGMAAAQTARDRATDTLIKAAFLHKFASFVEWPAGSFASATSPLRIGVLGDDGVFKDLADTSRDRDRDGRPVQAVRLAPGDAFTGFHILYLKGSDARLAEWLLRVPEAVLTVTDSDGELPRGGVISFFLEDGRVRLGASVEAATRQGLRLSARLLSAARIVQAIP
ncbi:MAG: YfiR family protein [Ramlibacter sp.]